MFELHLGAKLPISSEKFREGFFLTGNPGQGRSMTLAQTALEVIKNNQTGLLVDPYGDLAKDIKSHLKSMQAKKQVVFTDLEISQKELNAALKNKFVIAAGNFFEDGNRETTKKMYSLLEKFYKQAKEGQWLIVDEAFSCLTDTLFEKYLESKKIGLYHIFSAIDFYLLSKEERRRFAENIRNFIIYKPRHMNAVLMAKERKELESEKIKAIQQYHFQLLMDGKVSYHPGKYPIEEI